MSLLQTAKQKQERRDFVIIGCGRLGASLATSLSEHNHNVVVIDSDKNSFRKLSVSFGGLTLTGNATNLEVLTQAQIDAKTTVVCVTNRDNTNIMLAQIAKHLYGADRVMVRLYNAEREAVYQGQGIDTISPARLCEREFHQLLHQTPDGKRQEDVAL